MSPNEMVLAIGILLVALAISHGRASYWKAKAETLDRFTDDGGWAEEARFWRRVHNREAAESAEGIL